MNKPLAATVVKTNSRHPGIKTFTIAEACARDLANTYLRLARSYCANHDVPNAVSCCLEGLTLTFGISRPLMVRDQLHDLLHLLDPTAAVQTRIQSDACCVASATMHSSLLPTTQSRRMPTYLERLVSARQLLNYPSEYRRFNQAYAEAFACVTSGHSVHELYIVQYRGSCGSSASDNLYFSFVPAALISANGPYYPTDICAVVRT